MLVKLTRSNTILPVILRSNIFISQFHTLKERIYVKSASVAPVTRKQGSLQQISDLSQYVVNDLLSKTNVSKSEIDGLIVGNMLSPVLQNQSQLAAFIASRADLLGVDATTVDAACASGASAFRAGIFAIASGALKNVIVLGIESMIPYLDKATSGKEKYAEEMKKVTKGLAQASNFPTEGSKGSTFVSLNDQVMTEYLQTYDVDPDDFFYISENAHHNALTAEHALFRKEISMDNYMDSPFLGNSVRFLDCCPICNGAAAVLISSEGSLGQDVVVSGSSSRVDDIDLSRRENLLEMKAVKSSVEDCLNQAQIGRSEVSIYEVHDAYSIMTAVSLEACGFAGKGKSLSFVKNGHAGLEGKLPVSTFGGLKARGHPVGASGVYQLAEGYMQLTEAAENNQVDKVRHVLTSSFGGAATTVVSNLLSL
eukprot:maker-scaffold_51-snap-gene-0.7-mRNA-1 protein AED:0.24 eAED:0.24 QI:47/1/1/1/1/1/3/49/424